MSPTKYPRYQDYVIRDGRFVGEFEQMYRDFEDPWNQSVEERFAPDKALALNALAALAPKVVLELGCGLGHFTRRIRELGVPTVVGIDTSQTAVEKASRQASGCQFLRADLLDFDVYARFRPDVIVMAEITWYVLEKLGAFLDHLRAHYPRTYLIHLLTTYPGAQQRFGREYFTDFEGIRRFFGLHYLQYASIERPNQGSVARTYFLGRSAPLDASPFDATSADGAESGGSPRT